MKGRYGVWLGIVVFALVVACAPLLITSDRWLNFVVMSLFVAFLGQSWNVLGGYGGQFSFGHAAFFGTGAYMTAVLQIKLGVNAWAGFAAAGAGGAAVGGIVGFLSFRYGLRGSYFALVTLAFAEVLRIVANSVGFTGGGVGLLVPLKQTAENFQFTGKAGYLYVILALVVAGLVLAQWLERSRFGARLMAVRENEDAARALGVPAFATKMRAIALSGALAGLGGAFYVQYFLYIDPRIAYGPGISVEALLAPIVGGIGTIFGPVWGAVVLHGVGEAAKGLIGQIAGKDAIGLDQVFYGVLLIAIVLFMPQGFGGWLRRRTRRRGEGRDHA
ncbi:MAG: branched-chain amino acid ABC transporter permease [Alphaproteobacteria bacterium]